MTKKKRRWQAPLAMGGILVCCLVLYGGLLHYNRRQEQTAVQETEAEKLYSLETDQIRKISLEYEGESFAFVKNQEDWQVEGEEIFPLQQFYPADMASCLSGLIPVRSLGQDEGRQQEYGLDNPEVSVVFEDDGGGEYRLCFGSANGATGDYYGMTESGETYTFSAQDVSRFQYHLNDMVTAEEIPAISGSAIKSIAVKHGDEQWVLEQKTDGDLTVDPTDTLTWFAGLPDGSRMAVGIDAAASLSSAVTGLSVERCVEVEGGDRMEQYGLGDGGTVVTVDYTVAGEEETETEEHRVFRFRIGNQTEDGSYYMNIDGSRRINTMSQEAAETFLSLLPETLGSLDQANIAKSSVERITVEGGGIKKECRIETREETALEAQSGGDEAKTEGAADGDETEIVVNTYYYWDEAEIDGATFAELYDTFTDFSAQRFLSEEEMAGLMEGEAELTLTYHRKNGLSDVAVTFTPYNADFYLMRVDQSRPLLINKNYFSKIWEQLVQ